MKMTTPPKKSFIKSFHLPPRPQSLRRLLAVWYLHSLGLLRVMFDLRLPSASLKLGSVLWISQTIPSGIISESMTGPFATVLSQRARWSMFALRITPSGAPSRTLRSSLSPRFSLMLNVLVGCPTRKYTFADLTDPGLILGLRSR